MEPEPTPLSDQDKIRLKRLAKLQQQQQQQPITPDQQPVASTSSSTVPTPAPAAPVPAATPNKPKGITIKRAAPGPPTPAAPAVPARPAGFADTFAGWEDNALGSILGVTLNVDAAEASGWSVTYLTEVVEELESDGATKPYKITTQLADCLLLARLSLSPSAPTDDPVQLTVLASLPPNETHFEYLSGCWKRERLERSKIVARQAGDLAEATKRLESLAVVKGLVVSYLGLVLSDPTMFPQDHVTGKTLGPLELIPFLLDDASVQSRPSTSLQPNDFPALLHDLAARFTPSAANDYEGGLEDLLEPVLTHLGRQLLQHKVDIGGGGNQGAADWRALLGAVRSLSEVKAVAGTMTEMKSWDPTVAGGPMATAPAIEFYSLLGPFVRLSTFGDHFPAIPTSYFPDPETMGRGNIESAQTSLRGTLNGVQNSIFSILNNVVRAGPKPREALLALLGHVVGANKKRAALRVDPHSVSSHGYLINLHTALLSFASPFMDPTFSKIDKIDPLYFKHSDRIDVLEETKMSATQTEANEFYAKPAEGAEAGPAPNFISEVFFLNIAIQHVGVMHSIKAHKNIGQNISHYRRELADMEADTTWRGSPNEAMVQAQIDKYKKRMNKEKSLLHSFEVQLLDPAYIQKCVGFANLVMAWLVRLVDPKHAHPQTKVTLPMAGETPNNFRMLPEYIIEDITELLTFCSKFAPQVLAQGSQDELLTFMLVFLSTDHIKNPYLQGQFVEIMFYLTAPTQSSPRGCLGDTLNFHPLALGHLMPALLRAYVQIEITGSHTQFYDKFNTRYYITQLFKLVWDNPTHRDALKKESLKMDSYVKFVNLLMNDTTYLLDDALDKLAKIGEMQKQMDDTAGWQAKPAEERQEQEKLFRQWEGTAKSDLDLGREQLNLIKIFSKATKEPFLEGEIVNRLAAMLDMNLSLLAGPRCQDLKVRDPDKYKFRPTELLSDFLSIYLELGGRTEFQAAVARDGRSYSRDLFARAERIALKRGLKSEAEVARLREMVERVEEIKAEEEADEAMGDVPEEFEDPVTAEIMRDPVVLPSSKQIVDRSTIRQHHMSDATDPFNRAPLDLKDLVDAVELKGRIDEWLEERKGRRVAKAAEAAASTATAAGAGVEDVVMSE